MRDYHDLEVQAVERWLWDSGELVRLNEERVRLYSEYGSRPTTITAPDKRAWHVVTQLLGLDVKIDPSCTEAHVDLPTTV